MDKRTTPACPADGITPDPRQIHILVVDDERLSRIVVANLLRKLSYKVTVVEGGAQALAALQNEVAGTYQLVLTDVMMPEVDGLEVLRFVRSHQKLGSMPVVMMSASQSAETVQQCMQGGANDFFVKPLTQKDVQSIWRHVANRPSSTQPAALGRIGTGHAAARQPGAVNSTQPTPAGLVQQAQQQQAGSPLVQGMPAHKAEDGPGSGQGSGLGLHQARLGMTQHPSAAQQAACQSGARISSGQPPVAGNSHAPIPGGHGPDSATPGTEVQGGGSESVSLRAWLCRPQRTPCADDSWWVFTEALLFVEAAHKSRSEPVGRLLRPSRMILRTRRRDSTSVDRVAVAGGAGAGGQGGSRPEQGDAQGGVVGGAGGPQCGGSGSQGQDQAPMFLSLEWGHACASEGAEATDSPSPMAVGGEEEEEQAYASPEMLAGSPPSAASDVFSLGVLFFDLFYVPPASCGAQGRARALRDLRLRILPASFLRDMPRESAFTLALLHPDPAARPTIPELMASEVLGQGVLEAHRARRDAQATLVEHAAAKTAEEPGAGKQVLVDFLCLMHGRKLGEASKVQSEVEALDTDIALLQAHIDNLARAAKRLRLLPKGPSRTHLDTSQQQQQQQQQHHQQQQQQQQQQSMQEVPNQPGSCNLRWPTEQPTAHAPPAARAQQHTGQVQGLGAGFADSSDVVDEAAAVAGQRWGRVTTACAAQLEDVYLERRAAALAALAQHRNNTADVAGAAEGGPSAQAPTLQPTTQAGSNGGAQPQLGSSGTGTTTATGTGCSSPSGNVGHRRQHPHQPSTTGMVSRAQQPQPQSAPRTSQAAAAEGGTSPRGHPPGPGGGGSATGAARAQLPSYITAFSQDLSQFVRHAQLEALASLRHGGSALMPSASRMVCCAAFDRDDEFFATVGVSKRVRIYELGAVLGGAAKLGAECGAFPVLEISSRSRLSSVCWSPYIKAHLAASDYDGVVALWDAITNTEVLQLEEHNKRVWAVDISRADPMRLASGSDDGTVRVWSLNQETSVAQLHCAANACSVQFNPVVPHLLAVGTSACKALLYDLRAPAAPLAVMACHSKAVSYVRHASSTELVTASTDSTLRLWDLVQHAGGGAQQGGQPTCTTTYQGHTNERNFVGMSVSHSGYIACGSETNTVYCYYKGLPVPLLHHQFSGPPLSGHAHAQNGGLDGGGAEGQAAGAAAHGSAPFISTVAWAQHSDLLLAANSVGHIKVLALAS